MKTYVDFSQYLVFVYTVFCLHQVFTKVNTWCKQKPI